MLDARTHQGQFGEDYVRVLATVAGLVVLHQSIDNDGVDLGFRANGRHGNVFSPAIEAQVKTWSNPADSDGHLRFGGLNEWQFNRLAGPDFAVPRYLFVVCVPRDAGDYASFSTEGVLLRHLGFYVSLRDHAPLPAPDKKRRHTVLIPMANVLTARALRRLTESRTGW